MRTRVVPVKMNFLLDQAFHQNESTYRRSYQNREHTGRLNNSSSRSCLLVHCSPFVLLILARSL